MDAKKLIASYSTFLDFLNILRNVSNRDSVAIVSKLDNLEFVSREREEICLYY